jgi:hypothetical protein
MWLSFSLALFAVPWFFPMMIGKTSGTPIAYVLKDPDQWGMPGRIMAIVLMLFWFAIPAILTGWVLQAIVVFISDLKKRK